MVTPQSSYLNPSDSAKHERAIEFLARESRVPVIQVEQLYERELGILKLGARVTAFLDVLTSRKVRDTLRRQGNPLPAISERLRNLAIQ